MQVGSALHLIMKTQQIRKQIRSQRKQLSKKQQNLHEIALKRLILRSKILRRYKRFAIYLDNDGEIQTDSLIKLLLKLKKQVYLPVLYPLQHNRLWFLPYNKSTSLKLNRYKILEPTNYKERVTTCSLSVIFMPLVAFDEKGNRIGMGGGFYDRTLSHCKTQSQRHPVLIGLAHELQKLYLIDNNSWDIPMDMIITEKKIRNFLKL